jgi:hypothetical protein
MSFLIYIKLKSNFVICLFVKTMAQKNIKILTLLLKDLNIFQYG